VRSTETAGSVYVFAETAKSWSRVQVLRDPVNGHTGFGTAVAIAGPRIVVGAPLYGTMNCGRAYEFRLRGSKWTRADTLVNSGCPSTAEFGSAVAISSATALLGAPYQDGQAGGVYILGDLP
jgi:hypothetical protein